jgi:uroporphyrin-III C-methyltransferase
VQTPLTGFVSLVGAGPGDPELLTVKGLRRLQHADVVAYDRLANPLLLSECRTDAELIFVGKHGEGLHPSVAQEDINALLIDKARGGKQVVRLKGGDPFIFGRGGEEALELKQAGVPFEIVPGISSAIAAPAYAGIPVTHRHVSASVAIVAGHEDPAKGPSSHDWQALSGVDTLVILMGMGRLTAIAETLLSCGKHADTPAAVVRWGTTDEQQTVTGTLSSIAEDVRRAGLKAPATLIIGEVVRLRDELRWFDVETLVPNLAALESVHDAA